MDKGNKVVMVLQILEVLTQINQHLKEIIIFIGNN